MLPSQSLNTVLTIATIKTIYCDHDHYGCHHRYYLLSSRSLRLSPSLLSTIITITTAVTITPITTITITTTTVTIATIDYLLSS